MSEPRPDRCETCRFWEAEKSTDYRDGLCRRHSPRPVARTRQQEGEQVFNSLPLWPITLPIEWCGEWAPLPVAQKEERKA